MKTKIIFAATVLLLSVGQPSHAQSRIASDAFDVTEFQEVNANTLANIYITQSDTPAVRAEGSEDLLNRLEVEIKNGVLFLTMDKRYFKRLGRKSKKLDIYIATPLLSKISSEGVGNIRINDAFSTPALVISSDGVGNITAEALSSPSIRISSDGVGNITLGGTADNVKIESEGVGNIRTEKLKTKSIIVKSDGVGNVSCFASESIKIHANGLGNVTYYGSPTHKEIHKDGLGKVREGK